MKQGRATTRRNIETVNRGKSDFQARLHYKHYIMTVNFNFSF